MQLSMYMLTLGNCIKIHCFTTLKSSILRFFTFEPQVSRFLDVWAVCGDVWKHLHLLSCGDKVVNGLSSLQSLLHLDQKLHTRGHESQQFQFRVANSVSV